MEISKHKKMRFFLMSQRSLNPKIRFLGQKVWPVAREQTDRRTHTKVKTEGTLSGFQEVFLQPIIKDRPNKSITQQTSAIGVQFPEFVEFVLCDGDDVSPVVSIFALLQF